MPTTHARNTIIDRYLTSVMFFSGIHALIEMSAMLYFRQELNPIQLNTVYMFCLECFCKQTKVRVHTDVVDHIFPSKIYPVQVFGSQCWFAMTAMPHTNRTHRPVSSSFPTQFPHFLCCCTIPGGKPYIYTYSRHGVSRMLGEP